MMDDLTPPHWGEPEGKAMTVTKADEAAAEEIVSAANIVTNDCYYEIDTDAVVKVVAKHREDAERPLLERIEALEAENARLRAALGEIAVMPPAMTTSGQPVDMTTLPCQHMARRALGETQ